MSDRKHRKVLLKLAAGFCCVMPAFASLIPSSPFENNISGTGFGTVSTIITLQTANGQSTTEAGCIGFGGSNTNCGITQDGKIKNTSSLEATPTGVSNAADLRFIFNASEPSGGSITLQQLEVTFFGTGGALYTANLASSPVTLTSTFAGVGNSGFAFQLDTTEAAAVNALWAQIVDIGGGFSATGASGGQDTLFVGAVSPTGTPTPTGASAPEPTTVALLGGGLVLAGLLKARSRSSK